jgi:hypothetical protein
MYLIVIALMAMVDSLWEHKRACEQVMTTMFTPEEIAKIEHSEKNEHGGVPFRGLKLKDGQVVNVEVFPTGTDPAVIAKRRKMLGSSVLGSSCQMIVYA